PPARPPVTLRRDEEPMVVLRDALPHRDAGLRRAPRPEPAQPNAPRSNVPGLVPTRGLRLPHQRPQVLEVRSRRCRIERVQPRQVERGAGTVPPRREQRPRFTEQPEGRVAARFAVAAGVLGAGPFAARPPAPRPPPPPPPGRRGPR